MTHLIPVIQTSAVKGTFLACVSKREGEDEWQWNYLGEQDETTIERLSQNLVDMKLNGQLWAAWKPQLWTPSTMAAEDCVLVHPLCRILMDRENPNLTEALAFLNLRMVGENAALNVAHILAHLLNRLVKEDTHA